MTASDSLAAGGLAPAASPLDFTPPAAPAASRPVLTVDLEAVAANWRALQARSGRAEAARKLESSSL